MRAGQPTEPVEVPPSVVSIVDGRPVELLWRNQIGGLTFAVGQPVEFYLKWHPELGGVDLEAEAERMRWLGPRLACPEPWLVGSDDIGQWLCTWPLPGRSAVDDVWIADPATAVRAIGTGLRRLHDEVAVADCPFTWSTDERLAVARRRLTTGDLPADRAVGDEPTVAAADAVALLHADRPPDDPVVCHGDACAPNTVIDDDGRFLALVDLGSLGVGDRWGDLAAATWSTQWNYGPGWEEALLDAYGIERDPERIRYHRLLWDVGP